MLRRSSQVSLDELLDGAARAEAPRERRWALLGNFVLTAVAGGVVLALLAVPGAASLSDGTSMVANAWKAMPADLPLDTPIPEHTVLLDRNGQEFAQFFSQDRTPITDLGQVSPLLVSALLDTEDADFYHHHGINVTATARAALNNIAGGRTQGASTITQQLVKNIRLTTAASPEAAREIKSNSLSDKLVELRYATHLEDVLTKDEILLRYLNTVYFGDGAYGISAAARHYYGVGADQLDLNSAATIAGLLQSPDAYNPLKDPDAATKRRNTVLLRMKMVGTIDQATYAAAISAPLALNPGADLDNGCTASKYPFYCQYVRAQMLADPAFGSTTEQRAATVDRGGMTITTSLDPAVQDAATAAAKDALKPTNRVSTGVAVVQPGTGQVLALAGNRDFGEGEGQTQINYATREAFQPGSSFKLITLASAMEQGIPAATLTMAAPTGYRPPGLDAPKNGFRNDFSQSFGPINAYDATRMSVNTWYVELAARAGIKNVASMARRLGYDSMPTNLTGKEASITLGTYETSPLDMATVYATFAAHGVKCDPVGIISAVRTSSGEKVATPDPDCHQEISPEIADTITDVAQGPLGPGGTAAGMGLAGGRPAAGKTGTTNDSAATWFVGYTPQMATAVWVGDPRGGQQHPLDDITAYGRRYTNVFGATVAAPIWKNTMNAALAGTPVVGFTPPSQSSPLVALRTVPDVRGLTLAAAVGALEQGGYQVQVAAQTAADDALTPAGVVVAQNPDAGVAGERDQKVTLTLSAGSDTSAQVVP